MSDTEAIVRAKCALMGIKITGGSTFLMLDAQNSDYVFEKATGWLQQEMRSARSWTHAAQIISTLRPVSSCPDNVR